MKLLRPVIKVRDIPPNCASSRAALPTLRSLVPAQPHRDEAKILQYLQQGVAGCFYPDPGLARDVLDPEKKVDRQLPPEALGVTPPTGSATCSTSIAPSLVLTDGVWLWPSVLAYYVARYHVLVDPDFVDHARACNWTVRQTDLPLDDLSFDAFSIGG